MLNTETVSGGDDTIVVESQMSSQKVDSMIRSKAEAMATRLSGLRVRLPRAVIPEGAERTHEEVKRVVAAVGY